MLTIHRFRIRSKTGRTFCALTAACSAASLGVTPFMKSCRRSRSRIAPAGVPWRSSSAAHRAFQAVIHLFKLLALAGVMRAALGFIHTVIKARYGSGSDRKPIPRLSLAAPVAAPSKLFHTAALRTAGTRRASLG